MKQTWLKLIGILLVAVMVFAFPPIARADGDHPECPDSYDGKHHEDRGYGINRIEPTCTENGSYENIAWCMFCGQLLSRETVIIPATGHNWDWGTVTTPPTCTTDGVITYHCQTCGTPFTQAIPATGHTVATMPAKEATCEEVGLTEGQYCSTCGEILLYQYSSPALGHDWDEGVVQGEEDALLHDHDIVFTCSRCGKTHTETAEINSKNFWPTLYNNPVPNEVANLSFPLKITQQPKDLELIWEEGSMGMLTIGVSGGVEPYIYKWIMVPSEYKDSSPLGSSFTDKLEIMGAALTQGLDLAVSFGKAEGGHTGAACAKPAVIGSFTEILPGNEKYGDFVDAAAEKMPEYELMPSNAWITETDVPELQVEVGNAAEYTAWCIVYDDNGDHVTSDKVQIIPALKIIEQPYNINIEDPEAVFTVGAAYGKEPYTYQWQYFSYGPDKFVDIEESDAPDADTAVMKPVPGFDQVRCIVTDDNGKSVTSEPAMAYSAPVLEVSGSEDLFIRPGEPAQLSASFHGGVAPYTATWEKWGNGTSSVLTTQTFNEDPADIPVTYDLDSTDGSAYALYVFTVEDSAGQVKEWMVNVSYRELTIVTQPEDGQLNIDGDYEVSIEVGEGTMPFTYSLRDVTHKEIAPETTASSTWTYALHKSGIYYIYVTDANGLHAESDYFCVSDYEVKIVEQPDVIDIKDPRGWEAADLLIEGGEGPYTLAWFKMNEDTGAYEAIEYDEGWTSTIGYGDGCSIFLETEDWARLYTYKTGTYILEATDVNDVKGVSKPFTVRYTGTKPYIIVEPQDMEFEATSGRSNLTYALDCLAVTGSGEEELAYLWEYCEEDGIWQKAPLETLYARGPQYHWYADYPHQEFFNVNHSRLYRCRVTNMVTGEVAYSRTATVKLLMHCTHYGQGGKGNEVHAQFAGGAWSYSFQIREKYAPFWNEVQDLNGTDGNNRSYSWYDFIKYDQAEEYMLPYYPDENGQLVINFAGETYDVAVADTGKEIGEINIDGTVYCYATGIARRWRMPYGIDGEEAYHTASDYYHRVYQIMVKDWLGDTCTTPWFRMTSPMTDSEKAWNIFWYGILGLDPETGKEDHSGW